MTWCCKFCGRELEGHYYKVIDWKITHDGYSVECSHPVSVCKTCMNKGGW